MRIAWVLVCGAVVFAGCGSKTGENSVDPNNDEAIIARLDVPRQAAERWWLHSFRKPMDAQVEEVFRGKPKLLEHMRDAQRGEPMDRSGYPGWPVGWVRSEPYSYLTVFCRFETHVDPLGWWGYSQVVVMAITPPVFIKEWLPPSCDMVAELMLHVGTKCYVRDVEFCAEGEGYLWQLNGRLAGSSSEGGWFVMSQEERERGDPTIVGVFDGKEFQWKALIDKKGEYPLDALPEFWDGLVMKSRVSQAWHQW